MSAQALVLTRQYKSPKMVAPQRALRQCVLDNLDELKETPGRHRKWREVNPDDHGTWEWYEIAGEPAAAPVAAPAKPTRRK